MDAAPLSRKATAVPNETRKSRVADQAGFQYITCGADTPSELRLHLSSDKCLSTLPTETHPWDIEQLCALRCYVRFPFGIEFARS